MVHGDWKELFAAAGRGNVDIVKYHLDRGVDVRFQHPEYFTSPIFEAIRKGQLEICRILLEHCPELIELEEELSGDLPLITAMEAKQHAIVDYLTENFAAECQVPTILVTHAQSNIGRAVCNQLLDTSYAVMALVDSEQGQSTVSLLQNLTQETGNKKLTVYSMDFTSMQGVRETATKLRSTEFTSLVLLPPKQQLHAFPSITDENFEVNFVMNVGANFVLTETLTTRRTVLVQRATFSLPRRSCCSVHTTPSGQDFSIFTTGFRVQALARDILKVHVVQLPLFCGDVSEKIAWTATSDHVADPLPSPMAECDANVWREWLRDHLLGGSSSTGRSAKSKM